MEYVVLYIIAAVITGFTFRRLRRNDTAVLVFLTLVPVVNMFVALLIIMVAPFYGAIVLIDWLEQQRRLS